MVRKLEKFEINRGIPTTPGGFISCDCKNNVSDPGVFNSSDCKCTITNDISTAKTFRQRKLKNVTNVVIRIRK